MLPELRFSAVSLEHMFKLVSIVYFLVETEINCFLKSPLWLVCLKHAMYPISSHRLKWRLNRSVKKKKILVRSEFWGEVV